MANLKRLFFYFVLYSMLGWCYEVFLEVVVYRWGFTNRGVLFGPYCPVYGFGALLFLLLFSRLKQRGIHLGPVPITPVVLFLGCMVSATLLELATSYLLEFATGSWPWQTYVDYKYNFQGRIALSPSVRFGLGGVVFLYLVQPLFEKLADRLGPRRLSIITGGLAILLAADLLCTLFFRH